MNKVFILGAGASRELLFRTSTHDLGGVSQTLIHRLQGPLSSGFFYYANEFMKEMNKISPLGPNTKISNKWLINFIEEYYFKKNNNKVTFDELVNDESKSKGINIESLYIAVEDKLNEIERKRSGKYVEAEEFDPWFGRKDLLKYIHEVFSTIAFYCYSIYHRILANYIINQGGSVICFNWDILLEEEMYDTQKWDYKDGYGFDPAGFIDKNESLGEKYKYKERGFSSENIILKPHGSINWYQEYDPMEDKSVDTPKEIFIGIPLTRKGAFRGGTVPGQGRLSFSEIQNKKQIYESVIVPPGRKRGRFAFIWNDIKNLLTNADSIISIGFSFNDFDFHIVNEFKDMKFKESLAVDIVNPSFDIIEKHKVIFRTDRVTKTFNSFSGYCKWIVTQEGTEKFSKLLIG